MDTKGLSVGGAKGHSGAKHRAMNRLGPQGQPLYIGLDPWPLPLDQRQSMSIRNGSELGVSVTVDSIRSAGEVDVLDGDGKYAGNFPWDELYQRLDDEPEAVREYERLGEVLRVILEYLVGNELNRRHDPREAEAMIGRRTLVLAWVTNPALIEGGISQAEIARRLSIHKSVLARFAADVTRTFGIVNRAQSHGSGVRKPSKLHA